MASKRKSTKKRDPNQITAIAKPGEDEATGIARTVLRPTVQAAVTLKEYDKTFGDLDLVGLMEALSDISCLFVMPIALPRILVPPSK